MQAQSFAMMKRFLLPILILSVPGFFLLVTSCRDTTTHRPSISSMALSTDTALPGDFVQLTVKAWDADDQDFIYYYTVNGGKIMGEGDSVTWVAPAKPGRYLATLLLTDANGNQDMDSVSLVVLPKTGYTLLTGVAAFINDTAINMGSVDLANTPVFLYTSINNWVNQVPFLQTRTIGSGPNVSFKFVDIDTGYYYLGVWKDMDISTSRNAGDYWGWFGTGSFKPNDLPKPYPIHVVQDTSIEVHVGVRIIPQ